jgi:GNAT superfamily N-acetyltransferase
MQHGSDNPPEPALRAGEKRDVDDLTRLINLAFAVEQIAIPGERIDRKRTQAFLSAGAFFVFEGRTGLAGCVYAEARGNRGYLGLLAVEPSLQGRGFGSRLVAAGEEHLKRAGCRAVDLRVVSARSDLLPFYERLGYTRTGTSPIPPEIELKIPCHFIHMSKKLG